MNYNKKNMYSILLLNSEIKHRIIKMSLGKSAFFEEPGRISLKTELTDSEYLS